MSAISSDLDLFFSLFLFLLNYISKLSFWVFSAFYTFLWTFGVAFLSDLFRLFPRNNHFVSHPYIYGSKNSLFLA
jgi:hypothetical protein